MSNSKNYFTISPKRTLSNHSNLSKSLNGGSSHESLKDIQTLKVQGFFFLIFSSPDFILYLVFLLMFHCFLDCNL